MKTSELTGTALDWAVASCECHAPSIGYNNRVMVHPSKFRLQTAEWVWFQPSTNWEQGGPIIKEEKITVGYDHESTNIWIADKLNLTNEFFFTEKGSTPLIAAMRCYVASKLGDDVKIPNELAKEV
jgi:hypothetical protein